MDTKGTRPIEPIDIVRAVEATGHLYRCEVLSEEQCRAALLKLKPAMVELHRIVGRPIVGDMAVHFVEFIGDKAICRVWECAFAEQLSFPVATISAAPDDAPRDTCVLSSDDGGVTLYLSDFDEDTVVGVTDQVEQAESWASMAELTAWLSGQSEGFRDSLKVWNLKATRLVDDDDMPESSRRHVKEYLEKKTANDDAQVDACANELAGVAAT